MSGKASCRVTYTSSGRHIIKAVYSGTAAVFGSTSSPLSEVVRKR